MPRHAASVLTVEDDPITRADLRIVLEEAGFSVCADAKDGIEAEATRLEQEAFERGHLWRTSRTTDRKEE